jgi:hypothetical protein
MIGRRLSAVARAQALTARKRVSIVRAESPVLDGKIR